MSWAPASTPLQAGLGWVVAWEDARGYGPLAAKRGDVTRLLRGLEVDGRRPPRADCRVLVAGEVAGVVTSGNVCRRPLHRGIALAFLPPRWGGDRGGGRHPRHALRPPGWSRPRSTARRADGAGAVPEARPVMGRTAENPSSG